MKLNKIVRKKRLSIEWINDAQKWNKSELLNELSSLPIEVKRVGYFSILSEFLIEIRGHSKIKKFPMEKMGEFADELHNLPHMLMKYPSDFKDEFFWCINDYYVKNILLEWFINGIVFWESKSCR